MKRVCAEKQNDKSAAESLHRTVDGHIVLCACSACDGDGRADAQAHHLETKYAPSIAQAARFDKRKQV